MSDETPKKKPFAFEITYELFTPTGARVRDVLLRENLGVGQPLVLGIENALVQENETITLRTLPEASEREHHFRLQFAPGVLVSQAISAVGASWSVERVDGDDGAASLYVSWISEDVTIGPGERLMLALEGVSAAPGAGLPITLGLSWSEPVVKSEYIGALCITNPAGEGAGSDYELSATLDLGVRSRRGKPDIPLRAGFVGTNRVLNVKDQENTLFLRLANTTPAGSAAATVRFHKGATAELSSKLVVALPVGPQETHPWALGTTEQITKVQLGAVESWTMSGPAASADGTLQEWTFTPTSDVDLAPQAFLELSLSKLVTSHPDGPTHLVLRYSAVPGYWDGELVCPIEKAPLVFGHKVDATHDHRGNVGIGRSSPDAGLSLDGHLWMPDGKEIQNTGTLIFRADVDNNTLGDVAHFYHPWGAREPALKVTKTGELHPSGTLVLRPPLAQDQAENAVILAKLTGGDKDVGLLIGTQKNGDHQIALRLTPEGRVKDKSGFLVPVGTIVAYAGDAAPEGWLLCDRGAYKRAAPEYSDLFEVIGTKYNGSTSPADDEFCVPGPPDVAANSIIKY
ncbi:phage tail protein [Sorangium sp. So ce1504]|uniref:phage tail protein n=1 Tax=Sorangium sp. So ce1504 TaxID=3133337 RepID=UPI003F61B080